MGPQFFETMMGKRFFNQQLPELTKAINRLADAKEAENNTCNECTCKKDVNPNEYEITELCPHCEREVTMYWNVKKDGFKAFCPYCGERLMLCDECLHSNDVNGEVENCDYNSATNTCKHCREI